MSVDISGFTQLVQAQYSNQKITKIPKNAENSKFSIQVVDMNNSVLKLFGVDRKPDGFEFLNKNMTDSLLPIIIQAIRDGSEYIVEEINIEQYHTKSKLHVYSIMFLFNALKEGQINIYFIRKSQQNKIEDIVNRLKDRKVLAWSDSEKEKNLKESLLQEVSEREDAEEKLEYRENLYWQLFNEMLDGFIYCEIVTDENEKPVDYKFIEANPAFGEITGLNVEDIIGKTINDVVPGSGAEEVERFGKVALEGKSILFEKYSEQENKYLRIAAYSPKRGQFAALYSDITHLKEVEEELKDINEDLEERVEERTQKLQEINEELESFTYSVSHDLRAPLRHIDGFSNLLSKKYYEKLDDTGKRYLKVISEAAENLGNMIDRLLVLSRLGRREIKVQTIDVNQMIKDVLDTLNESSSNRKIRWDIDEFPKFEGDPTMINLVFQNLISNAVKYTRNKEEAEINLKYFDDDTNHKIVISDNGAGFSMDYVHKIFDVFTRLHGDEEFEGEGIGLTNVKKIVQKHKGEIWARGEEGKGAEFHIRLPKHIKGDSDG